MKQRTLKETEVLKANAPVITTNIVIDTQKIDFTKLSLIYNLVCYKVSHRFNPRSSSDWGKLHNEYKQKVDLPYYFHSPALNLYVLVPKTQQAISFTFDFLNHEANPVNLQFSEIETHVLIKLLQSQYFYTASDKDKEVCQPHFFILSEKQNNGLCLATKLTISSPPKLHNEQEDEIKELHLVPEARWLLPQTRDKINRSYISQSTYYSLETSSHIGNYFRQVKRQYVNDWIDNTEDTSVLYFEKPVQIKLKKAKIDWHTDNPNKQNQTRGYIAFDFQQKFVNYINQYLGALVASRKEYKQTTPIAGVVAPKKTELPGISETGLPIGSIKEIFVYDNRLQINSTPINEIPFDKIVEVIRNRYGSKLNVKFTVIEEARLQQEIDFCEPILLIQDVNSTEPFQDGGFLSIFEDPKQSFYEKYLHLPKQSLSINFLKKDAYTQERYLEYFDYNLEEFLEDIKEKPKNGTEDENKKKPANKLAVCLNELFLKTYIIKKWKINDFNNPDKYLPLCNTTSYMETYAYLHNKVFLYIHPEYKNLEFIEIDKPQGKKDMQRILQGLFGIDWQTVKEIFEKKYYLTDKPEDKKDVKEKNLYFIFSKNQCVELEEPEERVLFNFDKGDKRNVETKKGMEGIIYCKSSNSYTVGSSQGLNITTPRANPMRRFDTYIGDTFDAINILQTCAVQFVRNKQYTVYPYFFDLIKLYLENQNKNVMTDFE